MKDQDRIEMAADNCEVLRSRLEKYEDADGNPISTISEQAREIASLRRIISECAAACGEVVSVQCSEGFMAMLPDEIRSVISGKSREIASKQATIDGMNEAHQKVAQELSALKAQPSWVVLPEFIEHVKHARKELCRLEQSPLHIRQRLAQKLTDGIARLNSSPVSACEPCTCGGNPHTTECLYEHFLSYSGLIDHPLLRYAYFHGEGSGCDKPAASAGGVDERATPVKMEQDLDAVALCGCRIVHSQKNGNILVQCAQHARAALTASAPSHGEHGEQVRGWIPVSERLPGEIHAYGCRTNDVLCRTRSGKVIVALLARTTTGDAWYDQQSKERDVTHWMPLPAAPSAGSQGGDV